MIESLTQLNSKGPSHKAATRYYLSFLCLLLLLTCHLVYSSSSSINSINLYPSNQPRDDLDIIRQGVLTYMLWPQASELNDIIKQVEANLTLLDAKSCYWRDLNYSTRGRENWDPILHMFRLHSMVQVFTYPTSPYYNDSQLADRIHCVLNVWIQEDWQNPNWWSQ